MGWKIEFAASAEKELAKMDKAVIHRILSFLHERVAKADNPRSLGKALKGPLGDFWKYRVGDYRVVCDIQDQKIMILVVRMRHRSKVYR
jgi:mRNA interferase RelE/StbE